MLNLLKIETNANCSVYLSLELTLRIKNSHKFRKKDNFFNIIWSVSKIPRQVSQNKTNTCFDFYLKLTDYLKMFIP